MDGIKKRLSAPTPQITKRIAPPARPRPARPSRDVLYISRQDSLAMDKHEINYQKGTRLKKILVSILLLIMLVLISAGIFFLWKSFVISRKMNANVLAPTTLGQDVRSFISPIVPASNKELKGQADGRINILLLGAAGEHKPGGNLTDTIMVMSIDTQHNKVALLSLPRDFYVPIPASPAGGPDSTSFTKINALYPIGIKNEHGAEYVKQTVEKITGLPIHYFIALDFDGFEKVINDIGGVNITSERDIYDARYPGPNYSYQTFALSKGFHTLDGETALKYVRERHDDPQGDFGRAKRQQQVIQAAKNKMFSLQTFFNVAGMSNVLDTLGDNIKTDITFEDVDSLIKLATRVDLQNITNVVVDAWKPESLLKVAHVMLGSSQAFILAPRVGNYSEIQDVAKNIFDQEQLKQRAAQIQQEQAIIKLINKSGDQNLANKIQKLLTERIGIKKVHIYNGPQSQEIADQTTATDNSQGQKIYTLDELIKKLPAKVSQAESLQATDSNDADIVITLGSNLLDKYNLEEANVDDYNKAQEEEPIDSAMQNQ